jgi:hypothetical protein
MELTVDQALQQGVAAHKEGKLQDAERLYRAILQAQPNIQMPIIIWGYWLWRLASLLKLSPVQTGVGSQSPNRAVLAELH